MRLGAATLNRKIQVSTAKDKQAMPKKPQTLTEREGLNAVEAVFLKTFKWVFREQPTLDWGVDAHVEIVEEGQPTGKLFALQVKSGASYFKKVGDNYVYRGKLRHLQYWSNHSLPVYIILHNPETSLTLWRRVVQSDCVVKGKTWSIAIPSGNVLDERAKMFFEAGLPVDEEGSRRLRFALDADLMKRIGDQTVYFVWEDWVNKSLGLRNLKIYLGHYDDYPPKEPDIRHDGWYLPTHDVPLAMSILFPWVVYEYAEPVEGDPECEGHVLEGHLSDAAKGYLAAEEFFRNGPGPGDTKYPPEPFFEDRDDDDDAEFCEALRQDWEAETAEKGPVKMPTPDDF